MGSMDWEFPAQVVGTAYKEFKLSNTRGKYSRNSSPWEGAPSWWRKSGASQEYPDLPAVYRERSLPVVRGSGRGTGWGDDSGWWLDPAPPRIPSVGAGTEDHKEERKADRKD